MASKPALRNLLMNKTKRDGAVAIVIGVAVALAYKYGVQEQRRKTITNFYANYDADKDYERMKKLGLFQLVNNKVEEGVMTLDD